MIFLKLLADFEIDLTPGASEKPGKRRGMGPNRPKPTSPRGPQVLALTRTFSQGFARLAEKRPLTQRS
jgi:hypothetical protein